ncbi:12632_t:CDS:2 [Ambispora gerdemannii]|uniref:12632_t:CDS:1 n=1 Tax=Ambispora gerdemannii TaxID=144530 RepID=A0A9N9G1Y1_9GLOM|nr:12632_t:CDS:2 [Ambispora gerdemannii]
MSGHEAFEKLNTHCLETICEEPHLIFKSDDFLSLDEPMLIWLLKRDDLGLDEIEVWDYTIQWGIGNTENLSSHDVLMWTVDDFIALEKTLHQCIPLIRYFEIAADDYAEKVIPYKKILPKNLKKQLLTFHLTAGSEPPLSALPPRVLCATVAIDSVITNPRHAALIASWIKRRLETDISEYKFNLILRGSRDGFSNSIFRQTCAHLSSTVVLIKIRGSGKIIGGYQAGRWFNDYLKKNMDNLLDDDDSILEFPSRRPRQLSNPEMASNLNFLFSLGTGKNLRSVQLSFAEQRIYNSSQRNNNTHSGPFFYNDLFISDQANSNRLSWYQCQTYQPNLFNGQIGQHFFQVEEYEVFQAVVLMKLESYPEKF